MCAWVEVDAVLPSAPKSGDPTAVSGPAAQDGSDD